MDELFTPINPPPPKRLCPDCKVPLERIKSNFTISEVPGGLFTDDISIDIYSCPHCGLVRVYDAARRIAQEQEQKEAEEAARQPDHTLTLGAEAPRDPWEKKGLFGRKKDKPDWEG